MASSKELFKRTLQKTDKMAVEATGNTRYFVGQVCNRVEGVVVVDPNKFEVIKKSVNKTDENDAKTLALFLSKDMLPKARLKNQRGCPDQFPCWYKRQAGQTADYACQ